MIIKLSNEDFIMIYQPDELWFTSIETQGIY